MQVVKRFLAPVLGLAGLTVLAFAVLPAQGQPPEAPAPVVAPGNAACACSHSRRQPRGREDRDVHQ